MANPQTVVIEATVDRDVRAALLRLHPGMSTSAIVRLAMLRMLAAAGGDAEAYREASRTLVATPWPPAPPRAPRPHKTVATTPEIIAESVTNG